jgi:hypothetical protein
VNGDGIAMNGSHGKFFFNYYYYIYSIQFMNLFYLKTSSSIHAHGAVRFKNDPGLTKLATKAYIGRLAAHKLADTTVERTNEMINEYII